MLANKVDVVRASGSGVVFSYNYMDDGYINGSDGWIETGINCSHLVGSHGCLFEGNYTWNSDSDFTHGNVTHSTYFRNWMTGFRAPFQALDGTSIDDATGCCGPQRAIADHAYSYWDSFIGNIAGKAALVSSWAYRCATGNANNGCGPTIYNLGWNDVSSSTDGADCSMALSYPTVPTGGGSFPGYQTSCNGAVTSTITGAGCSADYNSNSAVYSPCVPILDGNYDYKTNSTQWAANDTAHVLPASFYLASKPGFFVNGSAIWPPIDPINGVVHNVPAQARWAACQPTPTAACVLGPQP